MRLGAVPSTPARRAKLDTQPCASLYRLPSNKEALLPLSAEVDHIAAAGPLADANGRALDMKDPERNIVCGDSGVTRRARRCPGAMAAVGGNRQPSSEMGWALAKKPSGMWRVRPATSPSGTIAVDVNSPSNCDTTEPLCQKARRRRRHPPRRPRVDRSESKIPKIRAANSRTCQPATLPWGTVP